MAYILFFRINLNKNYVRVTLHNFHIVHSSPAMACSASVCEIQRITVTVAIYIVVFQIS